MRPCRPPFAEPAPRELTADEARVAQALHRIGKFYVFLREVRAELFDEAFQAELAAISEPRGTAPVPTCRSVRPQTLSDPLRAVPRATPARSG
jgi:hypothetical protein